MRARARLLTRCAASLATSLACLGVARTARACWIQPEFGFFSSSFPANGGSLPQNAWLLLSGTRLGVGSLQASVDGRAIELHQANVAAPPGRILLGFSEALVAGQALSLRGQACQVEDPRYLGLPNGAVPAIASDPTQCDIALELRIVDAVQASLPVLGKPHLKVRDHSADDPSRVPGCQNPPTINYDLSWSLEAPLVEPEIARFYSVTLYSEADPTLSTQDTWPLPEQSQAFEVTLPRWDTQLGHAPCVRLTLSDSTGQSSVVHDACGAASCTLESYDGETSPCEPSEGCACRAAGQPRGSSSALALLLAFSLARVRTRAKRGPHSGH